MLDSDFAFHVDGASPAWTALVPVRFDYQDALSTPYSLRVLLHARGEPDSVDPFALVGKLGTLRIVTSTEPGIRAIHGLVAVAESRGPTDSGELFELTLVPPFARAMHRRRSRIFLEKSLEQVLAAVLFGDSRVSAGDPAPSPTSDLHDAFVVPEEKVAIRLRDSRRFTDPKARAYCVQYEESDFDFVARLLEEEGITYHVEHTTSAVVLVLSDHDGGRRRLDPWLALAPTLRGRHLDHVRLGARQRPGKVTLVDYNWQKPKLAMVAESGRDDDLFVRAYPGAFVDSPELGAPLARAALERLATEARFATAAGSCRLLDAGTLVHLGFGSARVEGEWLVTATRQHGVSPGELPSHAEAALLPGGVPFRAEVELCRRGSQSAPEESLFRPARATPKPRIAGTQTAVVMDEPGARGAEIHVGGPEGNENGCVRLRFHWDTEEERLAKEPASTWVRVSQVFAGAGGGSLHHPRVGTEVIVAFEEGDPDRPIVVGRVYNGVQPAPALGKGAATVSTMKTLASPGGKVMNEMSFDDTAGEEMVSLTAGKNMSSAIGHDRTESVANNSTSAVSVDRSEDTGANRSTHVGGNNEETVDGDETITVSGRQKVTLSAGQDQTVTADRNLTVSGPHTVSTGPEGYTVNGAQTVSVTAAKTESIAAAFDLTVGAAMTINAGASHTLNTPTATVNAPTMAENATDWTVSAGSTATIGTTTFLANASGDATIQGATVTVTASGDVVISGANVSIKGGNISLEGGSVKIAGGTVDITGGVVKVN
jgi:type VI secretion system secreted protein VgrG